MKKESFPCSVPGKNDWRANRVPNPLLSLVAVAGVSPRVLGVGYCGLWPKLNKIKLNGGDATVTHTRQQRSRAGTEHFSASQFVRDIRQFSRFP
jgi:hypothetical protein